MKFLATLLILLMTAAPAFGAVVVQEKAYDHDGVNFKGLVVYDDTVMEKRPGILVIHEWWGINDHMEMRAKQLAEMGYVAFVADMYGDGKSTTDPKEAGKWAGQVRGTPKMRARAEAALNVLAGLEQVDKSKLAAIGFCFGGTGVLDLAYGGADIAGVVSFHGGLFPPKPDEAKAIKAKILILHGAEDPHVKPEVIDEMQKAFIAANVDWQMMYYGGAVHSFTNPKAGDDKSKGSAYHERTAKRAWAEMGNFFKEIF